MKKFFTELLQASFFIGLIPILFRGFEYYLPTELEIVRLFATILTFGFIGFVFSLAK